MLENRTSDVTRTPPPLLPRPNGRGRPPQDPAIRRQRILDAAAKLFTASGYAGTSVAAVSRTARVTKRAIYELVGDKDALFREVCNRLCAEGGDFRFDAAIEQMAIDDILLSMSEQLLEYALDPKVVGFGRALAMACLNFPDLVVEVMTVGGGVLRRSIADVFRRLAADGRIAVIDPMEAADIFYDTIVGNKALRALQGYDEPFPSKAELKIRVDMVALGLFKCDGAAA